MEAAVRRGDLAAGDLLPTVRGLADELGVSPTTVAAAYRELRRRGVTVAAGRNGTRIRGRTPLASRLPPPPPPGVRDLTSGAADPQLLPEVPAVAGSGRRYGEPPVSPRLRPVAAERLAADGLDATHLAVVGGALDGIERILGAWTAVGDRVVVEDPGYSAVLDLVAAMGLQAVPAAVDDLGVRPDALRRALRSGATAVVVTPRAQNPTGAAWDAARAAALADVVAEHERGTAPADGVLWVEDDHAGPVAGTDPSTATPGRARWATVRSVSKWLGPDFRLAVLVGDATTVSRVEGRQALGAGWVSWLLQDTVAALWEDPATATLLRRATAAYAERRRALSDALGARGLPPAGRSGLTAWVPVPDEHAVTAAMLDAGWAVSPGERFRVATPPAVRIGLATLLPEEAPALADALVRALHRPLVRVD